MSYLRYLCLLAHSGVQHILCCAFRRLVYPMLTVSLDKSFRIAPSNSLTDVPVNQSEVEVVEEVLLLLYFYFKNNE
jgi:hypothetical protein